MDSFKELDESYGLADTPPGFKNIILYPHQRTSLKAALTIERGDTIYTYVDDRYSENIQVLNARAYSIAEPVGSGKSFIILAIILSSKIPKSITNRADFLITNYKFSYPTTLIKSNLLVVDKSILIQWREYIRNYTNLTLFVISDLNKLKLFIEEFKKYGGDLPYDIVLLKEGTVSKRINDKNRIFSIVADITSKYKWARIFYDDFPTQYIFAHSETMANITFGEFNIFVNADPEAITLLNSITIKDTQHANKFFYFNGNFHRDCITRSVYSPALKKFVISSASAFLNTYLTLPKYNMFVCLFKNRYNLFISAINNANTLTTIQIAEMLNSDAIESAAAELNIKPTTPADIFDKILGNNFVKYKSLRTKIEQIEHILSTAKLVEDSEDKNINATAKLEALERGKKITMTAITPYIKIQLQTECSRYKKQLDEISAVIRRLKENFAEKSCQVCLCPLDDMNTLIIKCCSIVLCDECAIRGCRITAENKKLRGKCSNCNRVVDLHRDFIFLNASMKIDEILEKKINEIDVPFCEEKDEQQNRCDEDIQREKQPKFWGVLDIIKGRETDNMRPRTNHTLKNMLNGLKDEPFTGTTRKFLIYTNHVETQQKLLKFLSSQGVKALELKGSAGAINHIINTFETGDVQVLLFSSVKYCSGMNIQFATDLIFMHNVVDKAIEEQVIGRAHRLLRKYNLNIFYMLYDNEYN